MERLRGGNRCGSIGPDVTDDLPRWTYRLQSIPGEIAYDISPCTGPHPEAAPHVLLLHGHSSRMSEFDRLLPALTPHAHVYRFDQPCCGASSNVDAEAVRARFGGLEPPSLVFLREVIGEFVLEVLRPRIPPGPSLRVAGGSLGGNLALWLGRRRPRYSWLRDIVVWSPGSAWKGDLFQTVGAPEARKRAEESWVDRGREFLEMVYCQAVVEILGIRLNRPQPWYWYGDGFGGGAKNARPKLRLGPHIVLCEGEKYPLMTETKARAIEASFQQAAQDFEPARAVWHWQVAGDQLAYSHRDRIRLATGSGPATGELQVSAHFLAGEEDSFDPADLHRYTLELFEETHAHFQAHPVPGIAVTWESKPGVGHSLHDELPEPLAQVLTDPDTRLA